MDYTKISSADLELKTVAELRELCREYELSGYSKARKDEIIEKIEDFYGTYSFEGEASSEDEKNIQGEASDESKLPYINTHVHSFLKNEKYQSLISISCGAASSNFPVVGRTVGFVKAQYREILNIDDLAEGIVNGNKVSDSYVLKSGDVLEFVRPAGTKG